MSEVCKTGYCCTRIENLCVQKGAQTILHDVGFHIHCGQLTSIIGRNGAGKTTLIKALLGEVKHTGTIHFHNHQGKHKKLRIGYVPQKLNLDENAPSTVYDFCATFLSKQPVFLWRGKKLTETICNQLTAFGAETLLNKKLCDLSGGELQRVLLSLAMNPLPDLLLLDEPVSGMDREGMEQFYQVLMDLKQNNDIAILMISHDFDYVKKYSDRVILLDKTVLCDDTPDVVLNSQAFRQTFQIGFTKEGSHVAI